MKLQGNFILSYIFDTARTARSELTLITNTLNISLCAV